MHDVRKKYIPSKKTEAEEDVVMGNIKQIKKELYQLHNNINFITDPVLMDQMIFQIKAAEVQYRYWYKLAREAHMAAPLPQDIPLPDER